MNTEMADKMIDAIAAALKTVDGSKADGGKTTLFSGTVESENGVRTVKSISGEIVSEFDANNFVDKIVGIAKAVVFAVYTVKKQDDAEREQREAEAKAEAKRVADEAAEKADEAEAEAKKAATAAQTARSEAVEAAKQAANPYYRRPTVKKYKKILVEDND